MPKSPDKPKPDRRFRFTVDGKPFETEEPRQTGAAIKLIAGVEASFGLFLEGRGQKHADRQIADNEVVDLSAPGNEEFYTSPAATFGSRIASPSVGR